MHHLAALCGVRLVVAALLVFPGSACCARMDEDIMISESKLTKDGANAVTQDSVGRFLDQYRNEAHLWAWMNGDHIDMRLFLALGREAGETEYSNKFSVDRRTIMQWYDIAAQVHKRERRPPFLTKLDQLRSSVSIRPEGSPSSIAAVKALLTQSNPDRLLDDSHQALFAYSLLTAAKIPELDRTVRQLISEHPTFLGDAALFSMLAGTYGPPFVKLLSEACLDAKSTDECAQLIGMATPLRRYGHESVQDFGRRALAWYEVNKGHLKMDHSALYPAPPLKPLFTTDPLENGREQ